MSPSDLINVKIVSVITTSYKFEVCCLRRYYHLTYLPHVRQQSLGFVADGNRRRNVSSNRGILEPEPFELPMPMPNRASENFQGCLPQSSLKKLGQMLTTLAILGHFERFSPGPNGSKVGCPVRLFKVICLLTLEPFGPGENLSNQPEIARAVRIWPKFFSDD